jgi:CelD/BcsL family acetyltransferase involved in cellulose biosynthesis
VDKEDQQTIAKIATHRGVSIKNLFRQKDVRAFFNHLLLAELEKERLRLEGKPKR